MLVYCLDYMSASLVRFDDGCQASPGVGAALVSAFDCRRAWALGRKRCPLTSAICGRQPAKQLHHQPTLERCERPREGGKDCELSQVLAGCGQAFSSGSSKALPKTLKDHTIDKQGSPM